MTVRKKEIDIAAMPLFPDEAVIATAVLGNDAALWPSIALSLERKGLPKAHPVVGKRYWPAVRAWFDKEHGIGRAPHTPDGDEDHSAWNRPRGRQRD